MTLRHLHIFIKVYQYSNITKAAQDLNIAQPSVSLAIKEMENYYNIKFFDRIGKRIYPTEASKKFYDYAIHIIELYQQMENDINNYQETSLTIGCSITIGQYKLIPLLTEFKKQLPNIKVYVKINNLKAIKQMLLDNQLDFALIEGNITNNTSFIMEPFYNHSLCFVAHPNHLLAKKKNVTLNELSHHNFLLREKGSATRSLIDSIFLANNLTVTPIIESASTTTLVEAVKANLGVSCIPYLFVEKAIQEKEIVAITITNINLKSPFSIVYHHNKYLTPPVKLFIELCKDNRLK